MSSGRGSVDLENDLEPMELARLNIQQFRRELETNQRVITSISILAKVPLIGVHTMLEYMEIWQRRDNQVAIGGNEPEGNRAAENYGVVDDNNNPRTLEVAQQDQLLEAFIYERTDSTNAERRNHQPKPRLSFSPVKISVRDDPTVNTLQIKVSLRDGGGNTNAVVVVYTPDIHHPLEREFRHHPRELEQLDLQNRRR